MKRFASAIGKNQRRSAATKPSSFAALESSFVARRIVFVAVSIAMKAPIIPFTA